MREKLNTCKVEKDVESTYKTEIIKTLPHAIITSPFGSDGLLEYKSLRTLLEFKFKEGLKKKLNQCNILVQCLWYIKKFEQSGTPLPSTIFVGDNQECFALRTQAITKYLDMDVDWNQAPSTASRNNPDIVKCLVEDQDITPFIFEINQSFSIRTAIEKLINLSDNVVRKIKITTDNIQSVYDYFQTNVMAGSKLSSNDQANLFIQLIVNPKDNYLHPNRKNTLITKFFGELRVSGSLFRSFFQHFNGEQYTPSEKDHLTSLVDRLVEDTTRRKKGEFYTPTQFVNLAHDYLDDAVGVQWTNNTVWDNCCGTMALTRDRKFQDLYCSTLEQSDLQTGTQMGYNPEAQVFVHDFLNQGLDQELPPGLQAAIKEKKPITILINPPYFTANKISRAEGDRQGGTVTETEVHKRMAGFKCAQNLYAQFIFKIVEVQKTHGNITLGIFCPPLFLTGETYKELRTFLFGHFRFHSGFLMKASEFSDVSAEWGVTFSVLVPGSDDRTEFDFDVIGRRPAPNFGLIKTRTKTFWNMDQRTKASQWVRELLPKGKTIEGPQVSSGVKVKQKGRGRMLPNSLGYFQCNSNNVYQNSSGVALYSGCFSGANGISVTKENLERVCSWFAARKTIKSNWLNQKDEYLVPSCLPEEFVLDSVIFSLFSGASNQSSLRGISYKGETWDLKNEFFWLPKDTVKKLAEDNNYDQIYHDLRTASDRYLAGYLKDKELSPEAQAVLDKVNEIFVKSFEFRELFSETNPELHLDSWDAGWYQIKFLAKKYYLHDLECYSILMEKLETKLRDQVYDLGFLRR